MLDLLRERDGDGCFYCGAVNENGFYHLDHVTPKSRGGTDEIENRVLACVACNLEKHTHAGWLFVLLRELGPVPKRLPVHLEPLGDVYGAGCLDVLREWAHDRVAARAGVA